MSTAVAAVEDLLGIDCPVLCAGMGGVAGPELAAAVAQAGGGGVVGLYRAGPDLTGRLLMSTRQRTSRPFGVNVIPEVAGPELLYSQLDKLLTCASPDVFLTSFGLPPAPLVEQVRASGRAMLVQVGSVAEASIAARYGATAVIGQGVEAGGHHLGTLRTLDLMAAIREARIGVPVLASGAAGCAQDVRRLVAAGAAGVSCGTPFLPTLESRAHPELKARVLAAGARDTVVTDVFSVGWPGRSHRVLRTARTMRSVDGDEPAFVGRTSIDGRPQLVASGSAVVPTTATTGRIESMALYCGTSCGRVTRTAGAAEVVRDLARGLRA